MARNHLVSFSFQKVPPFKTQFYVCFVRSKPSNPSSLARACQYRFLHLKTIRIRTVPRVCRVVLCSGVLYFARACCTLRGRVEQCEGVLFDVPYFTDTIVTFFPPHANEAPTPPGVHR
jgi:hypothetical protein